MPSSGASRAGRWVLAATILGSSLAFIDGSVVSVALPVLQADLGASVSDAQWIVEAYALFLASLILVAGSLADRFGRRRIFVIGTSIFAAASLACGLAPGAGAIIAARAVQGVGAALLVPSSLAILGAAFSEKERGRAVGTWSAMTSVTGAIGPALGGWLVQVVSWRAVFLINLPLAAAVLWIAVVHVPETRNPSPGRLDFAGAALATLGLAALVFGLIEAPIAGPGHVRAWGPVVLGLAVLAAFVLLERKIPHPMMPLRLFRNGTFTAANLLTLFLYAALYGVFFFLPFDLIQSRGYSPARAGLAIIPLVGLISALSRPAGALADRLGPRLPLTVGPAISGAGFFLFTVLPADASYAAGLLPALCVLGTGMGITVAPLTAAVLNAVPRDDQGAASGINNAVARVAALLSIAVLGIVAASVFNRNLDRELDAARVSAATRRILEPERAKLGAMTAPASAPLHEARAVERGVGVSLHQAFRVVCGIGTGLALLASSCALIGVRNGRARSPARRRDV